jgi:hypothetical protein
VVDINNTKEGDMEAEDIIVTDYKNEQYDCAPMGGKPGIASTYMFAATPELGKHKVLFQTLPCWCIACMSLDDDGCLFKSTTDIVLSFLFRRWLSFLFVTSCPHQLNL